MQQQQSRHREQSSGKGGSLREAGIAVQFGEVAGVLNKCLILPPGCGAFATETMGIGGVRRRAAARAGADLLCRIPRAPRKCHCSMGRLHCRRWCRGVATLLKVVYTI
ncbi:hypothetical protein PQU63_15155 [Xanthomonas protegens]|uniref:Uncharacterized protein n=1 Tax=Xanthomonas protegens TaxID=3380705 RepID=A0ABU9LFV5_9XANT